MSIQQQFTQRVYWPVVQKLKGEYAAQALEELDFTQWKTKTELLSDQWDLLKSAVNRALKEIPYYRQAADESGWDVSKRDFTYADFLNFPKLEKKTVRDCLPMLLNPNYKGRVTEGSTSGSTGQGLVLHYTSEHESYSEAARWRGKSWWGISPGSPHLTLWGRPYTGFKDRLVQKAKCRLMNTLLFSSFDTSKANIQKIWFHIRKFKPAIIYGYPSAVYALAEYLNNKSIRADSIGIKVIMITAELSTAGQRSFIEDVFGCPTANEYGCSETGGFVYECPDGGWHISTEITFIEFLNDQGNPVKPNERGKIVLTHLRNHYMPLIRYRVGDVGSPLDNTCKCGRGMPLMDVHVAKESDRIQLKNGKFYMSGVFLYIHKAVMSLFPNSILHFRVTQTRLDQFEVEIVPGTGAINRAQRFFEREMEGRFGKDITIAFRHVDEIARDPSGKLRYFISSINGGNSNTMILNER